MTTAAFSTELNALRADLGAIAGRVDALLDSYARAEHDRAGRAPAEADPLDGLRPLISVGEAADVLGLSRAAAYRHAAAGELPVRRLGGRVYVVTAKLRGVLEPETPAAVTA